MELQTTGQHILIETQYWPCIYTMHRMYGADTVCIEKYEHYQKGSYRNRAYVLAPQGKQLLSVPLEKGKHQQMPISDVRISYDMPWYAGHWHALRTAYGSSPFFMHYADDIRTILYQKFESLYALNGAILGWLSAQLKLPGRITHTETYHEPASSDVIDLRGKISPKQDFPVKAYEQVFSDRMPFVSNLSVLDLLMHKGPEARSYLLDFDRGRIR